ncbi:MAG: OPT oligopeptide transporter protein-domain-containing protein [Piptocephalis tieghemiana]|nr:MAG: OPT oligopeptide transporter protein-domain-containing protein [Piptocephalis tieghemiana]
MFNADYYDGYRGPDLEEEYYDDGDEPELPEEENSPIEIVAATVPIQDDPSLPCLTFRFWVLSTLFTALGAGISQFYYFRSNSPIYSIFFVQLVSFFLGKLMARILPTTYFSLGGWRFTLNHGPFNVKEHMLIGVAANAGGSVAYAVDIISVQKLYYGTEVPVIGALLLLLTTQCIGYGLSGIFRRFLIRPASMVWPANLVSVSLYNTLHASASPKRGRKRILRFFLIVSIGAFVYQFFPGYIAPILSAMSIVCWAAPTNGVAQLFGSGYQGLGFASFSFDWTAISTTGPLYTPWWAQINIFAGALSMCWIIVPAMWYSNVWGAWKYGLVTAEPFDLEGDAYDVLRVLDDNMVLDEARYAAYSPVQLSPMHVLVYGFCFLSITSSITHVLLYYRHAIFHQLREYKPSAARREEDVHTRMMRRYKGIPNVWYAALLLVNVVVAIITCEVYDVRLPWWGVLLAIAIAAILILPIGIIQAISNSQIPLNVLTELICAYIYPGRPMANIAFKVYGYMTSFQCLLFLSDLKLGHYMKIPPRKMFIVQLYGTILGVFINYGVMRWIFSTLLDTLTGVTPDPTGKWDARLTRIFYSASLIWGAVGPQRVFGPSSPYSPVLWCLLIGFFLPLPFYLLHRRYPQGKWHLVNVPIITYGAMLVPQYPTNFLITSLLVGWFFQSYLYRHRHGWWRKYNYVLSAALDSGTQIGAMLLFAALTTVEFPTWWGNSQPSSERCDVSLSLGGPDGPAPVPPPIILGG